MVKIGRFNLDGTVLPIVEVKQSELGTSCWLPARFIGGECSRYNRCTYPEKDNCKATAKNRLTAHLT